jgi:hypothetical protein
MKKSSIAILIGFAFTLMACTSAEKKQMLSIDNTKENIKNSIGTFTKVEKFKDETGNRYAYFKDSVLQLITVYYKEKNVDKNVEWYFSNDQLIYAEQKWTESETGKIVNNEKFYLSGGHLIVWIKTDNTKVDPSSQNFKYFDNKLGVYAEKLKQDNK